MKRICILMALLCVGLVSYSQEEGNPLILIISDQEAELKRLLAVPDKKFNDYSLIVTQCKKLAENYKRLGYSEEKESAKNANLRMSLVRYSDEARYANILATQFNTSYMKSRAERACKNARFVHRALGKPKAIYIDGFIDECNIFEKDDKGGPAGSDGDVSDSSNNKPEYIDEEFEKTLVGKRLFFKTPNQTFSINVYEPFVISEEQSIMRSVGLKQYQEVIKMFPEAQQKESAAKLDEAYGRAHWYNFGKDLGGVIFYSESLGTKGTKLMCEEEDHKDSGLVRWTSVSGVKACSANIYKHPKTGERLKGGTTLVQLKYKGELFSLLLIAGEKYNSSKHEKILRAMARSLRIEGKVDLPTVTVTKCKDETTTLLKKGMPVSWTIYDRTRKSVVLQQPVLARDHEVAKAASNYTGAVLEVIKLTSDIKQTISIPRKMLIDGKVKQSLLEIGGWGLEEYHGIDVIPVEIEDYTDVNIDGSLTTAVIFYLKALRDVNNGISGLGKKMNNMSLRLYWEIPTITITGECIPRMVCDNGEWKPDYDYMEFKEISRTKGTLRSPNKDFMTLRQVEQDLERYYYAELDRLEDNEANWARAMNRCDESKGKLYKIDWPVNFDKCPAIEDRIQVTQHEILTLEQLQEVRKKEMSRWLNTLKPAEIKKFQERLVQNRAYRATLVKERNRLIPIRDELLRQGRNGEAAELTDQITFLGEDIALLDSFETQTRKDLAEVQSGKRETAMSKELSGISKQISDLKKQKTTLKKQLEACVAQADKVR